MIESDRLIIRLPEGVEFSLRLAGPITRFLAWLIDCAVLFGILMFVGTMAAFFEVLGDAGAAIALLITFLITFGYSVFLEWAWRGQTLGKRILKLRVMDASGLRLTFGQILIRNLLRVADALPAFYLLGGIVCLFSPKNQRLGDLAANTIVIRQTNPPRPELDKLLEGKYNSLRAHAHLAARLRQKVDPRQAMLLLQALLRRDEITPEARLEFFAEAAKQLKRMVPFPEEINEALSDEAYVRNVVDILFRTRTKGAS